MALFDFKLENHFVGSSDGTSLQVYELTKSSADFSSIHKADWKKVATINLQPDDDVAGVDGGHACTGLRFFDERIEEAEVLTMLAQHLKQLRLLASPEGYCFQQVSYFGVHYLRLNDLFSWPRYGVKLVTVNTTWSRLEFQLLKDEDDHELVNTELQKSTKSSNINVLIVLLGELQRQLKKKDAELLMLQRNKAEEDIAKEERIQELEKLNEALEESATNLKKMNRELERQMKRKDDQVEMLKKKLDAEEEASETRIAELEKQKEDSEEANRAKDKELQKLHRQVKKKDGELEAKSQRIEDLEKMNGELEDAKQDDEVSKLKKSEIELRKLLKVKDKELQVLRKKKEDDEAEASKLKNEVVKLRKEKDDEVSKTVKVEGELKEVREKLSSSVAEMAEVKKTLDECREKNDETAKTKEVEAELEVVKGKLSYSVSEVAKVKKELEECGRNSWAILPSTKFLPRTLDDARDKYLSTRRRVPPRTFLCTSYTNASRVSNSHKLVDKMIVDGSYSVRLVDEESSPSEWPVLPTMTVSLPRGELDFDDKNWWYLKTTHPEGGLTMLVYYEGKRSQIYDHRSEVIPLPFSKGIREVYTVDHTFSIFWLYPFGVRYGFAYRPR